MIGILLRAAAAGITAGMTAQALEIVIRDPHLGTGQPLAAVAAAGWIGLVLGLPAALGLELGARVLGGSATPEARGRRLVAAGTGVGALLVGLGLAWIAGALAPLENLQAVTRTGIVAALVASAAVALACARLCPGGLARLLASPLGSAAAMGPLVLLGAASAWTWPDRLAPAPAGEARSPEGSVVLIVLDTTRADALGAYGGPPGDTPNFDRIAREGTLFEEVISPSPWTIPSHASLFTGLHPRTHGCWFGDRRWLDDEFDTLADRFAAAGYETAAFLSNGYLFLTNVLQGFEVRTPLFGPVDELVVTRFMRHTGVGWERWIDKGAVESVAEIDTWLAERDPSRPFFLFVNLFESHEPYLAPWRDRDLPEGVSQLGAIRSTRSFETTLWYSQRRDRGEAEDIVRALYADEVRYQDRRLGELLATLERQVGLDRLTLAITADHGENLGEGGRWGHVFALNDPLVHVPLVIRAPGRMPAGERVAGAFQSFDVAPTLLELAGLEGSLGEARSLMPGVREPREATFAEVYPDYFRIARLDVGIRPGLGEFRWPLLAVRRDGWKLVRSGSGAVHLRDLEADPEEAQDRAPEQRERLEALDRTLATWLESHPRRALRDAGRTPVDPAVRERLRALGYL